MADRFTVTSTTPGQVATHSGGTLAARPASPAAGDTYAVTTGAQTGARYTCFVTGSWEGTSLPTASAAGELPVSDGAGSAYTATTAGDVVDAAIASVVGAVAGQAIVGDGLGGVTETSADVSAVLAAASAAAALTALGGETALSRLPIASALHHWRCDESSSPLADLGSSPVDLAYVAGTREYARAGVYARYGCTLQRSPAATDRIEATVADIPSGSDISIGVTFSNETGWISAPGIAVIAAVSNGLGAGSSHGIYILSTNVGPGIYLAVHHGAVTGNSAAIAIDWSRPHRVEATYVSLTRTGTLYIDGVARATAVPASGTMAALTCCALGGVATAFAGVGGSALMTADFTVHLSALSAATVLSRADVCRRLAAG